MNDQTVKEFLFKECSVGLLSELAADGSEYWSSVEDFVNRNLDRKISWLSPKQKNWLVTIKDGLLDEARK